jgi:nucleotide-binding universal stress UspA family protein
MYSHMLIATDGSNLAGRAVDHGLMLAKGIGASVLFVTVTDMWSSVEMATESVRGVENPMKNYEEMVAALAEKILADAKTAADSVGVDCKMHHVSDSSPADGIIEAATEKGCDLIVMASHGRRGINLALLGSQTSKVLALSKIPVLVLR